MAVPSTAQEHGTVQIGLPAGWTRCVDFEPVTPVDEGKTFWEMLGRMDNDPFFGLEFNDMLQSTRDQETSFAVLVSGARSTADESSIFDHEGGHALSRHWH